MKPLLLDLYCGAGGAAVGYERAGFNVIGVDKTPQPHYPFSFIQGDALQYLDLMIESQPRGGGFWFDAVHASPPCQRYSRMSNCKPGLAATYPDLIAPTRERLVKLGVPCVIENVEGAPLINPVKLCGTSFGLGAYGLEIRRHRLFESHGFTLPAPQCRHQGYVLNPHNSVGRKRMREAGITQRKLEPSWYKAMGVEWAGKHGARESIPPVFATYIGWHLRAALSLDLPPWEAEAEALATLGRAA